MTLTRRREAAIVGLPLGTRLAQERVAWMFRC